MTEGKVSIHPPEICVNFGLPCYNMRNSDYQRDVFLPWHTISEQASTHLFLLIILTVEITTQAWLPLKYILLKQDFY